MYKMQDRGGRGAAEEGKDRDDRLEEEGGLLKARRADLNKKCL